MQLSLCGLVRFLTVSFHSFLYRLFTFVIPISVIRVYVSVWRGLDPGRTGPIDAYHARCHTTAPSKISHGAETPRPGEVVRAARGAQAMTWAVGARRALARAAF